MATAQRSESAIDFIKSYQLEIIWSSKVLGVSAYAVAGSLAEENHSYNDKFWVEDAILEMMILCN